MKIAMFTNTYLPHVGGVARSVKTFEEALRERGHDVRTVAPTFEGAEKSTDEVIRIPAIQNFNGSDFSVRLAVPNLVSDFLEVFDPDIIHSHHPFLLGDAALRGAWERQVPIVFTHHTMYENYTHYVPLDSEAMKRVAIQMATDYCNLCSAVIAPSESVQQLLAERGVTAPVEVNPTGIDADFFGGGNGNRFRERLDIPHDAFVIGHLGRLATEKNLQYLVRSVGPALQANPNAVFLVVGDGDAKDQMEAELLDHVSPERIVMAGSRSGQDLADSYAAMDLFAFASQSETQGMVLAEAMMAGKPVVAVDGPGVREVVKHEENGILLPGNATHVEYTAALKLLIEDKSRLKKYGEEAARSANAYTIDACTNRLMKIYEELIAEHRAGDDHDPTLWDSLLHRIEIEWNLLGQKASAVTAAFVETQATRAEID
jgi:glycosyltransferase involved in cell wall biosynthesis